MTEDATANLPVTDEVLDELRDVARELVWPGFRTRDEVVEALREYDPDLDPVALAAAAERLAGQAWTSRATELAGYADDGDHGRVVAAFDRLDGQGILPRMDFTCCQQCGTQEIDDERTPADAPAPWSGGYRYREWAFTFFHQQDSARLSEPEPVLYLGFGSFVPGPWADARDLESWQAGVRDPERLRRTDTRVGRAVADAMAAQGLDVRWDGSPASRVVVAVPDWRRPLPG